MRIQHILDVCDPISLAHQRRIGVHQMPGIQQDALLWIPDPVQQAGSFVQVCKGKARAFSSEPYFLMSAGMTRPNRYANLSDVITAL